MRPMPAALLAAAGLLGLAGCTEPDDTDVPFRPDAGDGGEATGYECRSSYDCSDGVYCNGVETCVSGFCVAADPIVCDDGLGCTVDSCNEELAGCNFTPDDALCDDLDPCTGVERCVPAEDGCVAGTPLICDDDQDCTDDYCEPETGACAVRLHDGDGDTHGDRRCFIDHPDGTREQGDDCNDADPAIFPDAEETCDDGLDNDCDRLTDVHDDTCFGTNDRCDAPEVIDGPGTYRGSTRGFGSDVTTSCGGGADAIYELRLTEAHDVGLSAYGDSDTTIAVRDACPGTADLVCGEGTVRARGLAPGTYTVIVKTASFGNYTLNVELSAPTESRYVSGNDRCTDAYDMVGGIGTTTVYIGSTVGMANDATAGCAGSAASPDAVYRLTLAEAASVWLDMNGSSWDTALHVKRDSCPDGAEVGCNDDTGTTSHSHLSLPLAAGTYYVFADGYSSSYSGPYELEVRISSP